MSPQTQPAASLLAMWHDALRAAGWEAITSETLGEVAARLEQGDIVWSLVIDRAARFRFVAARPLAADAWSDIEIDDRSYAAQHEYRHTVTVTGQIGPDLAPETLLADLAFVAEAPPVHNE
ncbi:MAG TPA: hypothetical protein P5148_02970 [Anaerolineae bacterium]|nr:hypothetical protein [Anaerolineae bacterium]